MCRTGAPSSMRTPRQVRTGSRTTFGEPSKRFLSREPDCLGRLGKPRLFLSRDRALFGRSQPSQPEIKRRVGARGFEPLTPAMSKRYSNQLSYAPRLRLSVRQHPAPWGNCVDTGNGSGGHAYWQRRPAWRRKWSGTAMASHPGGERCRHSTLKRRTLSVTETLRLAATKPL